MLIAGCVVYEEDMQFGAEIESTKRQQLMMPFLPHADISARLLTPGHRIRAKGQEQSYETRFQGARRCNQSGRLVKQMCIGITFMLAALNRTKNGGVSSTKTAVD